ncbi:MAG: ABC transporter ATP-binding protein [Sedimentisphaerales bacterium]
MTQDAESPRKSRLARRLLSYSLPYWRWMLLSLILILILSGLINYLPVLIKRITDSCLLNHDVTANERIGKLTYLSWMYLVDVRHDLFKKVTRLHQAYFDRTAVGALLTRVTTDIDRLQMFVTDGVVGTIADVFMLVSIMVYMLLINVQVALALFAALPLIFGALFFINGRLREANRMIRKRQASLNGLLQEDLVGMTTIQLFNREAAAQNEFMERNTDLRAAYFEEVRWFSLYFPVIEAGQAAAFLLILGTGGFLLLGNSGLISLGVLIAFLTYVRNFFRPLGSLSDKAGMFQTAMAAAERIFALIDIREEITDPDKPLEPRRIDGVIEFDHVWFAYEDENWVLKDLSFRIQPGEVVAVVGATGAGKSTIINLIGRFYDVQRGSVKIDGYDVRTFRKADLRQRLGYVLQDPFLFTATVADNISLLNPNLSRDALINAAKTVNADGFISEMPEGYDTVLNERGEGLSLGQKQLVSMARTLAQNPRLLLVMDEATANVDSATEMLIQDGLGKLMRQRTSIVIAHRFSTIRHADRILVMRHGELIDVGTHDELMKREGYYRQLHELLRRRPD